MNAYRKRWNKAVVSCMAVMTLIAGVNIPLVHSQDSPAEKGPVPAGAGATGETEGAAANRKGGDSTESAREGAESEKSLRLSKALVLGERNWLRRDEFLEKDSYQAQRRREAWRRVYLPSFTISQTRTGGDFLSSENEREVNARMDYLLYAGGRDRARYNAVRHAGQATALEQGEGLAEIRLQVTTAFLELLASSRRMKSLALAVEQAQREKGAMERRQELGLRTELEVMQARLVLEDERFNLNAERRARTEHALRLSLLVRVEVAPDTRLVSDLFTGKEPGPLAEYQEAALRNFKGLARLERERQRAREELLAAEGANVPEWLLSASLSDPDGEERIQTVTLGMVYRFGGSKATAEREDSRGTSSGQTYTFSGEKQSTNLGITFFDHQDPTADQGSRQAQARVNLVLATRAWIEGREARRQDVLVRHNALLSALDRLKLESLRVRKNELEHVAYRKSYQNGSVPYEDLLERQTALNLSRLTEINARAEMQLAWANLLHASGMALNSSSEQSR